MLHFNEIFWTYSELNQFILKRFFYRQSLWKYFVYVSVNPAPVHINLIFMIYREILFCIPYLYLLKGEVLGESRPTNYFGQKRP